MKARFRQLKEFHWQLFFSLCALALIPAVYQTVKTLIISSHSASDVFDIIGQMEWFDLINETIQAFLIVPLYSILSNLLKTDKEHFSRHVYKIGVISFLAYSLFSIGVLIHGSVLIQAMKADAFINVTTAGRYLQLETAAFMIGVILSFVNVVLVTVGKAKNVYRFLAVRTALSILADFILIPNFGVYGIAVSNIIVNLLLSVFSLGLLYRQGCIKPCRFQKSDLSTVKNWCRIGVFSGIQQFIDNFIYAIMICKMVNMVAEQGNYWLANNFIWGWLLIPITALAEVIKRDCKDGYRNLRQFSYYFIAGLTVILWAITLPFWQTFYQYVEHLPNADEVFSITVKLAPFYIAYVGSVIIDSIFIGLGKTSYNAINSLIVNFVYYGIFYILYVTNVLTFTMDVIILMFGCGNLVHLGISLIEEKIFLRKESQCLPSES